MKITADFHLHSRYSRATARDLDLESIYTASQMKGVHVVGSGDFCHPGWFAEIETKLEPAEPGLFRLKREIAAALDGGVPESCRGEVRYILSAEISNIYKKDGRTRKNHNLVLLPDLDSARRFTARLAAIGNISSDGRPILGLDARDLLEILLDICPRGMLIPAHIWTPWFSLLGSKSGFDSLAECFGDLTDQVFAVETGLSSDPEMNRRVSFLDPVTLVSNSDAHSPGNIGREANLFDTELSYDALRLALESRSRPGGGFLGTIEFFPEEGKYHLDGHRDCKVRLDPRERSEKGGLCPVCGKPVTVGVLSRVEELADRPAAQFPAGAPRSERLIPLADVVAEILQTGARSARVARACRQAVAILGPELAILRETPAADLERARIPLLREALERMRRGEILIEPGFDGQYGKIRLFGADERVRLLGQKALFTLTEEGAPTGRGRPRPAPAARPESLRPSPAPAADPSPAGLDPEQRRAVEHPVGPLLIVAGPGTGKTHTLTARIAHLLRRPGVSSEGVLALTFTRRAAEEMRSRLAAMSGLSDALPHVTTFHGLCWSLIREASPARPPIVLDEAEQRTLVAEAAAACGIDGGRRGLYERIMRLKSSGTIPDAAPTGGPVGGEAEEPLYAVYRAYQDRLAGQGALDYEDLLLETAGRLERDRGFLERCRRRFRHLFIDEFQDINPVQYRVIRALVPPEGGAASISAIGDPDQSIYGFRGCDAAFFDRFRADYPQAAVVRLVRNYRSTETILQASFQVIRRGPGEREPLQPAEAGGPPVGILVFESETEEAAGIARRVEALIGGTGYHALDRRRVAPSGEEATVGYRDVAVLARTHAVLGRIAERFEKEGIPFQLADRSRTLDHPAVAALFAFGRIVAGQATHADLRRSLPLFHPGTPVTALEGFKAFCLGKRLTAAEGLALAVRFPIAELSRRAQQRLHDFARLAASIASEIDPLPTREKLARLAARPPLADGFGDEAGRRALERFLALADGADDEPPAAFFARTALMVDAEFFHPRAEKVALLSMHAVKGLEFDVVFVAGCEEGLIPYRRPGAGPDDPAEERRLFYVALTRARRRLFLTRAARRRLHGRPTPAKPSPFLEEIDPGLVAAEEGSAARGRRSRAQLPLF